MKKFGLLAMFSALIAFGLVSCSSMGGMDKVSVCKKGCQSNFESCKEEAKDDTKKALECEAKKAACDKGCEESK